MFIAAGSQIGWTNIYGENIYDKIFDNKGEEKVGKEDVCGCGCGCKD